MNAHDVRKLKWCRSCNGLTDHPLGPQGETDGPPMYCVPCFVRDEGISGLNRLDIPSRAKVNLSDMIRCGLGLADEPYKFVIRDRFNYNQLRKFAEFETRVNRVQKRKP